MPHSRSPGASRLTTSFRFPSSWSPATTTRHSSIGRRSVRLQPDLASEPLLQPSDERIHFPQHVRFIRLEHIVISPRDTDDMRCWQTVLERLRLRLTL